MVMASLYQVSSTGRKVALGLLVFAIVITLWESLSGLFVSTETQSVPQFSYYKDADLALKNVPQLVTASIELGSNIKPTYSIDRLSNKLVSDLPSTAYVYKLEQPREKLTTVEDAIATAKKLGFNAECKPEGTVFPAGSDSCIYLDDIYRWSAQSNTKTLEFNKALQTWQLTTDWVNNVEVKKLGPLNKDLSSYINIAATIANSLKFPNGSFLDNPYVEYVAADLNTAGTFFVPDQVTSARFVFLEVYRKLVLAEPKTKEQLQLITQDKAILENIPSAMQGIVYGSDPRTGQISIIAGNNASNYPRDIFQLKFNDFEYSTRGVTKGIYPIIDLREAWSKAQNGGGFLVYLLPENGNTLESYTGLSVRSFIADATRTTLGYYERDDWNGFITPIFIFKGRAVLEDGRQASFTIFVDALKRLT